MKPEQFVQLAKNEHDHFLAAFLDPNSGSAVAAEIAALKLDPNRAAALERLIAGLLTDVFYTWLLALDGCASFGGQQRAYVLKDEDGSLLTDGGAIEAAAYEAFHGGPAGKV
jgi:hypothetical protein